MDLVNFVKKRPKTALAILSFTAGIYVAYSLCVKIMSVATILDAGFDTYEDLGVEN